MPVNAQQSDDVGQALGALLVERGQTLATAESCTGGLLAGLLTEGAGASAFYAGGVITYSNASKTALLGVDPEAVAREGAVSQSVAAQMAEGVRRRLEADYGVGITGIAGPTGGSDDKPVGLVFISVAGPDGVRTTRNVFPGDRSDVRRQSVRKALEMLREQLR